MDEHPHRQTVQGRAIYDEYNQILDITKPGDYSFKGGYQLSVRFPNSGLGGRAITVEIQARLTSAP
jgi:hypothetical protein